MNYCPLTLKPCARECVQICRDAPNDKFAVLPEEPTLARYNELVVRAAQGPEARAALLDEVLSVAIPTELRRLREDRKWTQLDVARRAKMPQSQVARLETVGAPLPSIKTLQRLAAVYDVALLVSFDSWSNFLVWASAYEHYPAAKSFEQEFSEDS